MFESLDWIETAKTKGWWGAAAVLIFVLLRLAKSDNSFPAFLPSRVRPFVAIGLGFASGVLQALLVGVPWSEAMIGAVLAAAAPMAFHDTVKAGANGAEIQVPGLMLEGHAKIAMLSDKRDDAVAVVHAIESEQVEEHLKLEETAAVAAPPVEQEDLSGARPAKPGELAAKVRAAKRLSRSRRRG